MDATPAITTAGPPRRPMAAAVLAALACGGLLAASSPWLPMAWDEGNTLHRATGVGEWFAEVLGHRTVDAPKPDGDRRPGPFSRQAIAESWRYTTQAEGHPALSGIVVAAGQAAGRGWLPPLQAARLGVALLCAAAAAAVAWRLGRDCSLLAAAAAVAAVLLQPRLFAHLHFASLDGPLCAAWLLSWAAFASACRGRRGATLLFGIALGTAFSAKFTGWLAPVPLIAWTALYRDRGGLRALAWGLPVAGLTFLALNPPLWHAPLTGLAEFFRLNLHRADNPDLNISIQFLGELYNLDHSLPWYNTLFWTAVTVPWPLLALALLGVVRAVLRRHREPHGVLILLSWATLLVVRALPGVPPHDGIRLFLPSFAMLALLAGLGADMLAAWSARYGRAAVAGLLLCSATSLAWYAPQWLSYYNLSLGGLRGATAVGMEPTYYWDALDHGVLEWLNRHTPQGRTVIFAAGPHDNLYWLQRWGTVRFAWGEDQPGEPLWYVLQQRCGAWQAEDRWLARHGRPVLVKTIRDGGWGPWRLDVPLVRVYPIAELAAADRGGDVEKDAETPSPE